MCSTPTASVVRTLLGHSEVGQVEQVVGAGRPVAETQVQQQAQQQAARAAAGRRSLTRIGMPTTSPPSEPLGIVIVPT